jgi:hypothetical protein
MCRGHRGKNSPLLDRRQPVVARRNRDGQHRHGHHVVCGEVCRRPHIPEQDDDGAEGEQRAERNCAAASDPSRAS